MAELNPKVYIVILNYNGWEDTIECLESVLRSDYPEYEVVVVDNHSVDNSLERFLDWAEGRLNIWLPADNPLKKLTIPPLDKPFFLRQHVWKKSGGIDANVIEKRDHTDNLRRKNPLHLIAASENTGFSGGNNIGIHYALSCGDADYVWLLNNDTVIERDALAKLIEKASADHTIGITGSCLMDYYHPRKTQALGGYLSLRWGKSRHITSEGDLNKVNYIIGASILISGACLDKVGLLAEAYFLYAEDADYCFRARKEGFKIAAARDSIVYHKEGNSSHGYWKDYYGIRSNLYFNYQHLRSSIITANTYVFFRILKRLVSFRFKSFAMTLRAVVDYRHRKMGRRL